MGSAAALILSALFSGMFAYMSADQQNEALEEAAEEAKALDEREYQDNRERERYQRKMDKYNMQWNEKMFAFEKAEKRQATRERAEERAYTRRERHFDKTMSLLNTNQALKGNTLGFLRRAA